MNIILLPLEIGLGLMQADMEADCVGVKARRKYQNMQVWIMLDDGQLNYLNPSFHPDPGKGWGHIEGLNQRLVCAYATVYVVVYVHSGAI